MARIRTYSTPHKGLRNLLNQFSDLAGQTDYADLAQVNKLKTLGNDLFAFLDEHAQIENDFVLKPLEARAKNASDHDKHDHEEIEVQQAALKRHLESLDGAQDQDAGHDFYLAASSFHSRYLEHIYHEETVTEKLMWEHFTEEELMGITGQILQSIPPQKMMTMLKYIIPAQNEAENLKILSGMKANAPKPAFEAVLATIKPVMSAERYQSLAQKLGV